MKKSALSGRTGFVALTTVAVMAIAAPAQAQTVIEVHNTMGEGGSEAAALERFNEILTERAEGEFEVRAYLGGQLGDETEVLELLNLGQTQMALTGGLFMSQYAPEYDAVGVPFVLPSFEAVELYIDSPSGQAMQEIALNDGGLVYLAPQKRAFRQMTSNVPIHEPADLQGLTMRLPQLPVWVDVWEELGAQAVVIPAPDIYLAMRTGQVQAHENSLASPYTRQMWEVQDYIIMTNHLSFPWHWVASARWWETLNEDQQTLIREAVEEARLYGAEVEDESDAFYREALTAEGMEFIDVDTALFRAAAQPAIDRALSGMADGVREDIEAAIAESMN